jgi:hypothetical protein
VFPDDGLGMLLELLWSNLLRKVLHSFSVHSETRHVGSSRSLARSGVSLIVLTMSVWLSSSRAPVRLTDYREQNDFCMSYLALREASEKT